MKVVEMFSGIGSQAKALSKIAKKRKINIEIVKTCEWDIHAFLAYKLIHHDNHISKEVNQLTKDELIKVLSHYTLSSNGKTELDSRQLKSFSIDLLKHLYDAIIKNNNLVNIKEVSGSDIPSDTELLTYSFPCQDLSNVGSFHGYKNGIDKDKDTRSGLLWEIERILEEKHVDSQRLPKFLLLENVTALEAERHKSNFNQWQDKLSNLGYINKIYKLNALDFGVPQNRKRLLMLSVYIGEDNELKHEIEKYWAINDLNDINYINTLEIVKLKLSNILKINYSNPVFLTEALMSQPNDTKSRKKIWNENYKLIDKDGKKTEKVQTITTKQDRHPNSGNIYFELDNGKSNYRFLTPRECFILMGFDEKDYEQLSNFGFYSRKNSLFFSRDTLNKLAGNSIVVPVLEQVFNQMLEIKVLLKNYS